MANSLLIQLTLVSEETNEVLGETWLDGHHKCAECCAHYKECIDIERGYARFCAPDMVSADTDWKEGFIADYKEILARRATES